jgi:hypothetical protein
VFNNPPPLPTKLSGVFPAGGTGVFSIAAIPESSGVVYIADQDQAGTREVYRVSFAAAGFPTKLNPAFAPGKRAEEIAVTSDSESVVYRANQSTMTAAVELYRVFITSPGTSTKLNGPLVLGGNVEAFTLS